MNDSQKRPLHWLEYLKMVLDIAVLAVMVWAVIVSLTANDTARQATVTSREANAIARQAINSSHVPWLRVTGIGVDTNGTVRYTMTNFSDTPALRLKVETLILGIKGTPSTYSQDALMPHEGGTFSFRYAGPQPDVVHGALTKGDSPILFRITYENLFGQNYTIEQETRWIDDMYRDTKYEMLGLNMSHTESKQ